VFKIKEKMKQLEITHFGPIEKVDIEFGDITVLVGPQATGKSLFLQFLNLTLDYPSIIKTLKTYGFTLNSLEDLLGHYLGVDLAKTWNEKSSILKNEKAFNIAGLLKRKPRDFAKKTFYIPAQRVLIMEEGWPRPFLSLTSYPYVVKDYSERLRTIMEAGLGSGKALFPQKGRLKKTISDKIHDAIFRNAAITLDTEFKKRLVLQVEGHSRMQLPITFWSAGQREFLPLLLGLFCLAPSSRVPEKGGIETVIIEELEMGLHPEAITGVMLAVMELLNRGYKVVLSTHSLHVVEMVWAVEEIRKSTVNYDIKLKAFKKLFNIDSPGADIKKIAESCLDKIYKVFYLKPGEKNGLVRSRDITSLDPSEDDPEISGWGGLSEFSSNIVDVVSSLQDV
jgi:energy-coupling factor transporter ATP-binding protein EcfA2